MDVLLSIRPKYVESIISGQKKYEFRKSPFRHKNINTCYIYSTSPIKRIIGAFKIGNIIEDHPEILWEKLSDHSGMDKSDFFNYFKDNKVGFAIEIKNLKRFECPLDPTKVIPGFRPPMSFCYIKSCMIPKECGSEENNRRLSEF